MPNHRLQLRLSCLCCLFGDGCRFFLFPSFFFNDRLYFINVLHFLFLSPYPVIDDGPHKLITNIKSTSPTQYTNIEFITTRIWWSIIWKMAMIWIESNMVMIWINKKKLVLKFLSWQIKCDALYSITCGKSSMITTKQKSSHYNQQLQITKTNNLN